MKTKKYVEYMVEETKKILAIDSPSGYTAEVADYVMKAYQKLGYEPKLTTKGGVLVALGGKDKKNAVMLEAHIDTLGAMVAQIKSDGRLRVTPIGGMNANNAEAENCRIHTRFGKKVYEGTLQLANASIHVNGDYNDKKRTFDETEIVLDEKVHSREDVEALGIMTGDIVCFDPRTTVTESGYIKSRFLDDKLSVGILLGYARYLKEENVTPERMIYQHITVFEEVGHGGSFVPEDTAEMISVDMGCVGADLGCTERMVSICAKDSGGPYNYDLVTELSNIAKEEQLDYAIDVYPHYGSDVEATLHAGYDIRHGLIGPGVYASHNYERSHLDGVKNTFLLLTTYITR